MIVLSHPYPHWVTDQLMRDYYDHHWGIPLHDEQALFRMLTLEIFQAGLSWSTVWRKREVFDQAFANFNIEQIAQFDDYQVEQLMQNANIIRNRRKINATVNNARVLLQYHQAGKTLDHFLWSFVKNKPLNLHAQVNTVLPAKTPLSTEIAKQMKRAGFHFTGPTIIFSLLCATGIVNARIE